MIHDPKLAEAQPVNLELNHAIRKALESAARAVESLPGTNKHYQAAHKRAARIIRGLKPD